jgi:hypothetical protein
VRVFLTMHAITSSLCVCLIMPLIKHHFCIAALQINCFIVISFSLLCSALSLSLARHSPPFCFIKHEHHHLKRCVRISGENFLIKKEQKYRRQDVAARARKLRARGTHERAEPELRKRKFHSGHHRRIKIALSRSHCSNSSRRVSSFKRTFFQSATNKRVKLIKREPESEKEEKNFCLIAVQSRMQLSGNSRGNFFG